MTIPNFLAIFCLLAFFPETNITMAAGYSAVVVSCRGFFMGKFGGSLFWFMPDLHILNKKYAGIKPDDSFVVYPYKSLTLKLFGLFLTVSFTGDESPCTPEQAKLAQEIVDNNKKTV